MLCFLYKISATRKVKIVRMEIIKGHVMLTICFALLFQIKLSTAGTLPTTEENTGTATESTGATTFSPSPNCPAFPPRGTVALFVCTQEILSALKNNTHECESDSQCDPNQICCHSWCNTLVCKNNKPLLSCPAVPDNQGPCPSQPGNICQLDSDCQSGELCCNDGCQTRCVNGV